ncbi:MAG TPA: ABC transporter permease [Terracidiphilus sp.]|nr:ABC transporter permease [Terracidiphilus sp.]
MSSEKFADRKSRRDSTFDREIDFHIEKLTQDYVAQGMSPEEARRRALVEFGGGEQIRQQVREVHVSAFFEALMAHLKAAFRFLRKSPTFSLAVILTLALGIGANSAVFSAIDAVVIRPLPYPDGDQLAVVRQHDWKQRDANTFVAPVRLEDWNRMASAFQGISGYYLDDLSELSGPLPEKITEALVAPRFLQVLEVSPVLGRNFTPQEEHWGGPDAVILSYGYWQRRFHGDASAIGQKVHIGKYYYPIVGVMPAWFQIPNRDVDLWTPSAPDAPFAQSRDATWFTVVGRMKPGVTLNQAMANLNTVQGQLGKQFPKPDAELTVDATPLKQEIVGTTSNSLWLLYGSVTLLLLIACLNIAALLLARTADREHEISIRFSLGASRRVIVFQLLTEIFLLALNGSLVGLGLADAAARGFHRLAETMPRAQEIALNWRVAAYTLVSAVATTLLCGLFPAIRGTRGGLAHSLASTARTQVSTRNRFQWTLVGMQVTLAVTLLVGAGLLLRSFHELGRVHPGFDPSHVLTLQVSGSWGETGDMKALAQRIDRTLDGLRTLPGVEAAATSATLPGVASKYQQELKIDGKLEPGRKILADVRWVSFGYFGTVGIPVLMGTACRQSEAMQDIDIVVNQSFTNLYLGGTSAIGHKLEQAASTDNSTRGIVRGIVGDAREEGLNEPPIPTIYGCYSAPDPFPNYLIRTQSDPMQMADSIRRRIHELEPSRSVYAIMPLQDHLDDAFSENRLRTALLALFAATAVSLACIGLYGTVSYLARLRQREVGVRLALGAMRGRIVVGFVLQALRVAVAGCLAGLALGVGMTHFISGMLYGVSTLDPATYSGVVVLILLVAALASLLPAVRVARIEPVRILREE